MRWYYDYWCNYLFRRRRLEVLSRHSPEFDLCELCQWRQSCLRSVIFAWCIATTWLGNDLITEDSPRGSAADMLGIPMWGFTRKHGNQGNLGIPHPVNSANMFIFMLSVCYCFQILTKIGMTRQSLVKLPKSNFRKILSPILGMLHADRRTNWQEWRR